MDQPIDSSSRAGCRARRFGANSVLLLLAVTLLGPAATARAQSPVRNAGLDAYVRDIAKARSDLDSGRIAESRKLLQDTDKKLRGFEFDYLQARAEQASGDGKAPPDLIRKVPKPEVETRFGVLDELQRRVVYICRDGSLHVYDLAKTEAAPNRIKHPQDAAVWTGAFSHDGKTFVSGYQNGDVLVWDAARWEVRHTIGLGNNWPVRELAVAPDGSACVAESMKALELWSLAGEKPSKVADVGDRLNFGEGLAFSPQGDLLATGGMFDINLHDARTGAKTRSMRHASYTMGLEFSPDGSRIASAPRGNVNKFLAVFDVKQNAPLFNAGPFGNYVAGLAFSPDGSRIAATGCEKLLRIFDSATGKIVLALDRPECGVKPAFSRDGRLLGWNEREGFLFIDLGSRLKE